MMQVTTSHREKGQNMAERRETRQEQEVRWDAQRTARDKEFQAGQHARHKKNRRTWLIVAVIVLIIAVIAAVVLL
jgi:Flp pilus assembly protein TadB